MPASEPSPSLGLPDRVVRVVLPATAIVIAMRRRARRRAGMQAWRYRTHHEASADSARIVSARYQEELDVCAEESAVRSGQEPPGNHHRGAQ